MHAFSILLLLSACIFPALAQEATTNAPPRQVAFEAKWVEIPATAFASLNLGSGSTNDSGTNWVLSPEQMTQLLQTVQAMTNATLIAGPRVIGWTHQDARLAVQEDMVILTGIKPVAAVPPGITAEKIDEAFETQLVPVGQWIDVLPEFSEEKFHLTIVAERTEMQGYDRSAHNVTVLAWVNNKRVELKKPVPRYCKTRRFNVADVPSGSTLVFGEFKPEDSFAALSTSSNSRIFLVLLTPVVFDTKAPQGRP